MEKHDFHKLPLADGQQWWVKEQPTIVPPQDHSWDKEDEEPPAVVCYVYKDAACLLAVRMTNNNNNPPTYARMITKEDLCGIYAWQDGAKLEEHKYTYITYHPVDEPSLDAEEIHKWQMYASWGWTPADIGLLVPGRLYRKKKMNTMADVLRAYEHTTLANKLETVTSDILGDQNEGCRTLIKVVAELMDVPTNVAGFEVTVMKALCERKE